MRSNELPESVVVEIRQLRYMGATGAQLREHCRINYGVTLSTPHIFRICRGDNYSAFAGPRVTASRKKFIRKLNANAAA